MQKLVVANWKMHNPPLGPWKRFRAPKNVKTVICPPFPYLMSVKRAIKGSALGAQNLFWENPKGGGAFTGEISANMLTGLGVEYVIIGHSESRKFFHETDEEVNKKVRVALAAGLKVILCVGESWAMRKKGFPAAKKFVAKQLKYDLRGLSSVVGRLPVRSQAQAGKSSVTIAYEPIWAIGTGKADSPENAAEMVQFIKKTLFAKPYSLNPAVLYGGSVNPKNARAFLSRKEIDGALVGGASVHAKDFAKIIKTIK
ncbi:MAG: triose-phosphate isomerase [bacterium]|nr:triose-phosphate isomerase [bacterium]